jgi:hypothetical protein
MGEKLLKMPPPACAAKTYDLLANQADIGSGGQDRLEERADFILGLAKGLGQNDVKSGFRLIARSLVARGWTPPRVSSLVSGYLAQLDLYLRLPEGERGRVENVIREELGLASPKE